MTVPAAACCRCKFGAVLGHAGADKLPLARCSFFDGLINWGAGLLTRHQIQDHFVTTTLHVAGSLVAIGFDTFTSNV
jgi:hypothetical protein